MIAVLQYMGFVPLRDFLLQDDGAGPYIKQWLSAQPQPTPAQITAAVLPAAKSARIAAINAECTRRITNTWPVEKQLSALAGVYGQAQLDAMTAWVDGHIAASNTASDAVDSASTIAAVEAVAVSWPG